MERRKWFGLVQPGKLNDYERLEVALRLSVTAFASTIAAWMGLHIDILGPDWWVALLRTVMLAAAIGLGLAFLATALVWTIAAATQQNRMPWLLVTMSLVMYAILIEAVTTRPDAYKSMAVGILAALIIAVATISRVNSPSSDDEEK